MILDQISCIYYSILFKNIEIKAFINLNKEVNTIILAYASKLSLKICYTNIKTQKINNSNLKIFEIVLTSFQIENKLERAQFFEKTLLLANIDIKIIFVIIF